MTKWIVCDVCLGAGKKKIKSKKNKNNNFNKTYQISKSVLKKCNICDGNGIINSINFNSDKNNKLPHVVIIGLGIGGIALAIACLHRQIPFSIYERDENFNSRTQGYGLTLQQVSKILKSFGIFKLTNGIVSNRHLVHTSEGKIIAEWGMRKWVKTDDEDVKKQSNIHISRQNLRLEFLNQLPTQQKIFWNHQFLEFENDSNKGLTISFLNKGEFKKVKADIIVGADGIRSSVRNQLLGTSYKPLVYLDCMVILGICKLDQLKYLNSELLDNKTVFQTANGKERLYVMPFTNDSIMWQFSFKIDEKEAIKLSKSGSKKLKERAIERLNWHKPIPEIIKYSDEALISGYPVYDREVLDCELKKSNLPITLIGDAAHPMSPFKGQGANQAILDALDLANAIYKSYRYKSENTISIRELFLNDFEDKMIKRSSVKVKDSALASNFLHSLDVLYESNQPRRKLDL